MNATKKAKKRTPSQLIMRQIVERDHAVRASLTDLKVLIRPVVDHIAADEGIREQIRQTLDFQRAQITEKDITIAALHKELWQLRANRCFFCSRS